MIIINYNYIIIIFCNYLKNILKILFFYVKWQRFAYFCAQSYYIWDSYCLIGPVLNRVVKEVNCAQLGCSHCYWAYTISYGLQFYELGYIHRDFHRSLTRIIAKCPSVEIQDDHIQFRYTRPRTSTCALLSIKV